MYIVPESWDIHKIGVEVQNRTNTHSKHGFDNTPTTTLLLLYINEYKPQYASLLTYKIFNSSDQTKPQID